ncbi:MAG: beta strand repeat-containing protein [Pirellulales bacterium]
MTRRLASIFVVLLLGSLSSTAFAQRSWDGGNATFVWGDNGNWSPDGSPSAQAVSIGDLPAAANDTTLVDAFYSINSLAITNGADIVNSTDSGATNDFRLLVNGLTTVSDAGSTIQVYGGDSEGLDTDNLTINSGASLILNSASAQGTAIVQVDGDTGTGLFDINSGGTLSGAGQIHLDAAPAAATTLLSNDGSIIASAPGVFILAPPVGTLQITSASVNARFDWDGTGGNGILQAGGNQTLDIDVAPGAGAGADPFSGTMNLFTGSTINVANAWSLDSGTINANTPAFGFIIIGQDPDPGPAAHIAGAAWTMTGGTINVDDTWDSLTFDSAVTASGGTINNSGTMIFNANATFQSAVDFNMDSARSSLVVNAEVNIDTPDFQLDGAGGAGSTTINAGGILDLDLGAGADLNLEHTINLNIGELDVTTSAATSWTISGVVNVGGGGTSFINSAGETLVIGGDINVAGNSGLTVNSVSEFASAAAVSIAAGSNLNMGTVTYNGGSYTGAGELRKGTATINAPTTWNVATVDLDDGATTLNANLTINADAVEEGSDGVDLTHTINDGALLTVNLTSGGWTLDPGAAINYLGNASAESYLAGSDLKLDGTINHTGDGRIDARLAISSTGVININTAAEPLRLSGGDNTANPNRISGGTINGPGILGADAGSALHGFGTIAADVDFDSSANLKADNGVLSITVGTAIIDVNEIGTADADGVLAVGSPWNTNVTTSVELNGGEVTGAAITNNGANGINGHGVLSAPVNNNTRIDAEGGLLIVQAPANNNEWDGVANTGALNAESGNLEIRDNAPFAYSGTVRAEAGREVFANGFELEFEPASTLVLNGGRYRSTGNNRFGGTMTVGAGTADIVVGGTALFESTSSTTIAGTLRLNNPATQIDAGATFAGGGTLLNTVSNTLRIQDGADVDVLVENRGDLVIGSNVAQATGLDFQQDATGLWLVDLEGLGLNQFDRFTLTGAAKLDGTLSMDIGGGYVPAAGDTLNILSAVGGVTGGFSSVLQPGGMPAGLIFEVVYQPTLVQLVAVNFLPGDYNENGVVDAADYTNWQDTLGQEVVEYSGADGNGNGIIDQADYDVWTANFGSTLGTGAGALAPVSVPEPASALLLLGGVAAILGRVRWSRSIHRA